MSTGLAYLTVVLVWATTPLAIKWSAEGGAAAGSLMLRMLIATALGILLLWCSGGRMRWHRRALLGYLAAVPGVFGAMALTYRASASVPSGLISVMYGLAPLLSGLMLQCLPGSVRLRGWHWAGCVIGVIGLAVIFSDALVGGGRLAAVLMLFGGVCLFCGSAIAVQRAAAGQPPLNQTLGALILSLPCFVAMWLLSGEPTAIPLTERGLWAVLYLSLFGSLLGFLCYYLVLSRLPAATVALITLMTPVLALGLGMLLNGEQPALSMLVGAGLIVVALGAYLYGDRRGMRGAPVVES